MKRVENNFSFDLQGIDHAIVDGIRLALENVMPEIMIDNNLFERNGYGQFRWNVIISQLRDKCQHLGWLELDTCARGGWKTPVLFHPASSNIFTLMAEETFKRTQRRKDKGKHYLCGAAAFNHDVVPKYDQLEMDLPGVSADMKEWVVKSQEQLAKAIHAQVGEIAGHILILFDSHADKLLSVRAVRLTEVLEISTEEEDWSRYINMPYAADQKIEPQQNCEDEEEKLVELL